MGTYYAVLGGSRILNASRVDQSGSDNADVTNWDKTNNIIVAVNINSAGKDTVAAQYKLQWRDETDNPGGAFTDLASTGECKFGTTDLVNGAAILVGGRKCDSQGGDTWQNGEEVEGTALSDSINLPDEYETEIHFSVSLADADYSDQYTFNLYDSTNDRSTGTLGAVITLAAEPATQLVHTDSGEDYCLFSDNDGSAITITQTYIVQTAECYSLLDDNGGEPLTLTQTHILSINGADHLHYADNVAFPANLEIAESYHVLTNDDITWDDITTDFTEYSGTTFPDWTFQFDQTEGAISINETPTHPAMEGSKSVKLVGEIAGYDASSWDVLGTGGGDIEILVRVAVLVNDQQFCTPMILARMNGTYPTMRGWCMGITQGTANVGFFNDSPGPTLFVNGINLPGYPDDFADRWYWMRLRIADNVSTGYIGWWGKSWLDGKPEPDEWQISGTNQYAMRSYSGWNGIYVYGGSGPGELPGAEIDFYGANKHGKIKPVKKPDTPYIVIGDFYHTHVADNLTLVQTHSLSINDAYNLLDDNDGNPIALTQTHELVIEECYHENVADPVVLDADTSLVISETYHQNIVDSFALSQIHELSTAETYHEHVADPLALTQTHILTITESSHDHVGDAIEISQTHDLTVAEAYSEHIADQIALTQLHDLVTAEAYSEHYGDNIALSQVHELSIDESSHDLVSDNISLSGVVALEISESYHDISTDPISLVQTHSIVIAECYHENIVDSPVLTQSHELAVNDSDSEHAADSINLTQDHTLVISEAYSEHAADNIILITQGSLSVAESYHLHEADSPILTQTHNLAIQESHSEHFADGISIVQVYDLLVEESYHLHEADNLILNVSTTLAIAEAYSEHYGDNVALGQLHSLAVQEAYSDHAADNVSLGGTANLVVDGCANTHFVDNIILEVIYNISVFECYHEHTVDSIVLEQICNLVISDAYHDISSDILTLVTPAILNISETYHYHSVDSLTLTTSAGLSATIGETRIISLTPRRSLISMTPIRRLAA